MNKFKKLREKRAAAFARIDELRLAADGREMTAEEQAQWDALLKNYEKVDAAVNREERFQERWSPVRQSMDRKIVGR